MSELWNAAMKNKVLFWCVAGQIVFYSLGSLIMSWLATTNGLDMSLMNWCVWMQTILGAIGNWCLVMAAFLDKTAGRVSKGEFPSTESETK